MHINGRTRAWLWAGALGLAALLGGPVVWYGCSASSAAVPDFNRDIRPILNNRCLKCHGGVREAGQLNLLTRENALRGGKSGRPAIVPGKPGESEMFARITSADPGERMPKKADPLTPAQVTAVQRWIASGAAWEPHWSYVLPERRPPPPTRSGAWARNDIDRFIARRLEREGLRPSPEAPRETLIRRVYLALTGLPPSPEEVRAFVAESDPAAYEKVVDRLLASPRFGERWASWWMDLARYADSCGYEKDAHRDMWRYRDWLIDAFNRDLPFDRFTEEQLAGDLLEGAGEDQLIATAFHRGTLRNDEGGTDDEEYRVAATIDRVNTTMEIWQGVTFGCVQCHGHPYEPFAHREYYRMLAFFNNTQDNDSADDHPTLPAVSIADRERKGDLDARRKELEAELQALAAVDTNKIAALRGDLEQVKKDIAALPVCKLPVMKELPPEKARTTQVFERGNFLNKGEQVTADTPRALSPFPEGAPRNRLGLARWLTSPANPLTARVVVNRFWEQLFGAGLVETVEDFGTQGEKPSHPELLDALAVAFRTEMQWSVKSLLRELVLSAAYRQSSRVSPELLERDPANRLLARGPRFRLSAEQVRDQALAVSGLLSSRMYGPSVMPYQPAGIWMSPYDGRDWQPSAGEDAHRRALYTYWRRSSPYPSAVNLDMPSREFCVSRRIRTNTPLQALGLLNDPVYVEAAEALARRMAAEGGGDVDGRLARGFELALCRAPRGTELEELKRLHADAAKCTPADGALAVVAGALLNLDEMVTMP
jgi:hypothetical protein